MLKQTRTNARTNARTNKQMTNYEEYTLLHDLRVYTSNRYRTSYACDDMNYLSSIQTAARKGYLGILKWFKEEIGWTLDKRISFYAAQGGQLEVLQWLHSCGVPMDKQEACQEASANGHVEVVKWLVDSGDCRLKAITFTHFAQNGDLEMLKWLKDHKCPWNYWTTYNAAKNGHLEALIWLIDNGCPFRRENCLNASKKHDSVVDWLLNITL